MASTIQHEWRERTEDGEVRFVRARKFGDRWTFEARLKSEEAFAALDPVPRADLEQLRDVLWRKYQRRRVPYEYVEQIDAMLEEEE